MYRARFDTDLPPSGMDPGDVCQELMMYTSGAGVSFGWQDTQSTRCLSDGGSGSDSGFDPFAGDPTWTPNDPGVGSDDSRVWGGTSTGKPTPQQVFVAVGRRLQPFQHAVGCGGASLIAAGTAVLDANGISELRSLLIGERVAVSMVNAASIGTARGSIVAVSVSTSLVRVPADATAVAHWATTDARDAAVAIGFDKARRESTPWWGYLPGGASYAAALSAGEACK